MADSEITPAPHDPPPRTKSGEVLREGRRFGQWVSSLRPDQVQSVSLLGMTAFLCMGLGWVLYRSDLTREKDKDRDLSFREAQTRECNTQGELIRQANTIEQDKNRVATAELAKSVQSSQKEMMDMMLRHQAEERQKDRLHDIERDREHLRTVKEIRDAWAAFAVRISDLDRFLRKKDGPEENNVRGVLGVPRKLISPLPDSSPK